MNTRHSRRGTALTLAILVAVIISGLVAAMAWVAGESAARAASLTKVDQAFFAAEAGMERFEWYCKNWQMYSVVSPLTGTVNGYSYTTSWSRSVNTITVTSVGTNGRVSYTLYEQITLPTRPVPAVQSGGPFDNKNIDIIGDAYAGTNYSNAGSGLLDGNLVYHGTASGTGSVTGTITHASGAAPKIDFTDLGNTLVAAAGATYSGDQTGVTFDFTAIPGENKVIYVDGNVKFPTFIGTGTLYVKGTIETDAFGANGAPVHLVATGDITTANSIDIYGSIFTKKDWNRGKFNLYGMVYTEGIVTSNLGQSYLTQGNTIWFDPRGTLMTGPGTPPVMATKFSGPLP